MVAISKWPPYTVNIENFSFSQKIYVSLIWFAIYGSKHCIIESKKAELCKYYNSKWLLAAILDFWVIWKSCFSDIPYHAAHRFWVIFTEEVYFWVCYLLILSEKYQKRQRKTELNKTTKLWDTCGVEDIKTMKWK